MPKKAKVSGETGKTKTRHCVKCSRAKVGARHTGQQREMARMRPSDRALSRVITRPYVMQEHTLELRNLKGSRDAFLEHKHEQAVKNSDKMLRAPKEEKKDDKIYAGHAACQRCPMQVSGPSAWEIARVAQTHDIMHVAVKNQALRRAYGMVPDISLR